MIPAPSEPLKLASLSAFSLPHRLDDTKHAYQVTQRSLLVRSLRPQCCMHELKIYIVRPYDSNIRKCLLVQRFFVSRNMYL